MVESEVSVPEVYPVTSAEGTAHSPRIGLLDHMGYGNLGDAAIQESIIANIRKRLPNVTFVAFSLRPEDTTRRHNVPCYPLQWSCPVPRTAGDTPAIWGGRWKNLKSALKNNRLVHFFAKPIVDLARELRFCISSYRTLRGLDVLMISGGGQLGDLWNGPWSHPYTILKFSTLTRLAGKKLYFFDVGAGPLDHWLSRLFIKLSVQLGNYRSFRDEDSQALVTGLGVRGTTYVSPDPVYALDVDEIVGRVSKRRGMPVIGLNPFGYCDPRVWPRKDAAKYESYLNKIAQFANWLLDQGYTVHVFTTEVSVDKRAIEDLKSRLDSRLASSKLIFRPASENVKDVLHEIVECDLIVTSKFHGIIFSHLLNKPVISLSYHRKMDVVMQAAEQSVYCKPVEEFSVEWLTTTLSSLLSRSHEVEAHFARMVAGRRTALREQFDRVFLPLASSF